VNCGKSVAGSEDVPWIFWFALLFVSAIATVSPGPRFLEHAGTKQYTAA
jgi:hypothetical protein